MRNFPVIPPVAATDIMLDERDSAAVTGHTVVESSIVSVTSTVDAPSGRLVRIAESAGQSSTVVAQLKTVWT